METSSLRTPDYARKPQRNCTFMNSTSGVRRREEKEKLKQFIITKQNKRRGIWQIKILTQNQLNFLLHIFLADPP
jgi:hypothetical protein